MTAARCALLVEGESDRAAVRTLAELRGLDLEHSGVELLAMGGVTNVARYVAEAGPTGRGLRLTGLYDEREERFVRRGLERSGLTPAQGRDGLSELGFHCCVTDLEDELIRALGVPRTLEVVEAAGELESFRLLQRQPYQRGRPIEDHLHRFLGAGSGRKVRYGRLLVEALGADGAPAPLRAVLDDAVGPGAGR